MWECPYKYNSEKANFKSWFCRVVINLSIDFLRKQKPTYDVNDYEPASNNENSEEAILRIAKEKKVEEAIAKLPVRQKTALNLIVYENLSYDEASEVMNLKSGAVKSLVMRAKANMKNYLEGEDLND